MDDKCSEMPRMSSEIIQSDDISQKCFSSISGQIMTEHLSERPITKFSVSSSSFRSSSHITKIIRFIRRIERISRKPDHSPFNRDYLELISLNLDDAVNIIDGPNYLQIFCNKFWSSALVWHLIPRCE